jgi:Leucine-rich repeat (LRR) protein
MLLFVLVVAVGMSTIRILFRAAFAQKAAVADIEKHWGSVEYRVEQNESTWDAFLREHLGNEFFGHVVCVRSVLETEFRLEDLISLPEVEQLELSGAQVNSAGLAHLKALPHLWILSLNGTNISDADLEQIGGLPRLKWLDLSRTQISDVGLEHLKSLSRLTLLHLTDTKVTDQGVKKLQQALPDCKIYKDD